MKKHNAKFAQRWARMDGDRSNAPARLSHMLANDKQFQLTANHLLRSILARTDYEVEQRAEQAKVDQMGDALRKLSQGAQHA